MNEWVPLTLSPKGTCIGERNYRFYVAFVYLTTVLSVFVAVFCALNLKSAYKRYVEPCAIVHKVHDSACIPPYPSFFALLNATTSHIVEGSMCPKTYESVLQSVYGYAWGPVR